MLKFCRMKLLHVLWNRHSNLSSSSKFEHICRLINNGLLAYRQLVKGNNHLARMFWVTEIWHEHCNSWPYSGGSFGCTGSKLWRSGIAATNNKDICLEQLLAFKVTLERVTLMIHKMKKKRLSSRGGCHYERTLF